MPSSFFGSEAMSLRLRPWIFIRSAFQHPFLHVQITLQIRKLLKQHEAFLLVLPRKSSTTVHERDWAFQISRQPPNRFFSFYESRMMRMRNQDGVGLVKQVGSTCRIYN